MFPLKKIKLVIFGQLFLIVVSVIFCLSCNIFSLTTLNQDVVGLKCLIVLSILWIVFSFLFLKIRILNVYTVFIITVLMYNASYIVLSFINLDDNILYSTIWFGIFMQYSRTVVVDYLEIILFFTLFIHLGALFSFYFNGISDVSDNWKYDKKMESLGLFLFYMFLIPTIYYYYSYLSQVFSSGGYINKYGISTENLGFIIRISDDFLKLGFFILLSSKSKIKRIIVPCVIFLMFNFFFSIITGSRVYFVSQALFILVYFSMRIRISNTVIFSILLSFVLFSVLVERMRSSEDYDFQSAVNVSESSYYENYIEPFVFSQGASMHIVGLTRSLIEQDRIDFSIRYLFNPLFVGIGYDKTKLTRDYYFLADRLSSELIPTEFSQGAGLGSSIIAEFYICGGLVMLVLLSFLYGYIICFFDAKKSKNNELFLFFIILLPGLFYVGRAHPLYPFFSTIKVFVLYFIFIKSGFLNSLIRVLRIKI